MALRVLTAEEKQALQGNTAFIDLAHWSVRDYAAYWAYNDGAGATTEALRIKWAKDRILGIQIELNDINDSQIPLKYVKLAKGMEFDLAASPVDPATIVAAFVADNRFEELASLYFTIQGESINLMIGG